MDNTKPKTPQEMKEKINSFQHEVFVCGSKKSQVSYSVNVVITVLSDLLSGLLVGGGIGYLIYKLFNLQIWVVALFVLLGGFAGFLNLYKSLERLQKAGKNENA